MTFVVTFLFITGVAAITTLILKKIHEDNIQNGTPLPQEGLHRLPVNY